MSVAEEFATVDLLLGTQFETRGVDAFALSLIKTERQIRKLFTFLVYQFPAFGFGDIGALRQTLGANRRVYFDGFITGFDTLYPTPVQSLIGTDYVRLKDRIDKAIDHRNKIFHGQLTAHLLTRQDLVDFAGDLKSWCTTLAASAKQEFEYDGFARNSFQKASNNTLWQRYRVQLRSVADYEAFIRTYMQR